MKRFWLWLCSDNGQRFLFLLSVGIAEAMAEQWGYTEVRNELSQTSEIQG
jgi:hypothetical protein